MKLTPKALAALHLFITRPGQVVTKDELFQTVWLDTVVSDDALTSCIQELRRALRDNAKRPRYIETVYRRGFRFIGKVVSGQHAVGRKEGRIASSQYSVVSGPFTYPAPNPQHLASTLVGREKGMEQLHRWLEKALNGERQIVFVTGEPGIGKTTVVEAFLSQVRSSQSAVEEKPEENQKSKGKGQKAKIPNTRSLVANTQSLTPNLWVGRGQCIEHYGAGEGYLPILEALGRLCRESGGRRLSELLGHHAPTWLGQMPALLSTPEVEALQPRILGATRERMLRELAEALEVVTAERPLVLVLEDLHWSDVSTLDFLSALARRQEPCRLLVLGTYRPVDVFVRAHPLKAIKQELQMHGHCQELALDFLNEGEVSQYLAVRFPVGATGRAPLQALARDVYRRTDGNPLFLVNLVEHLLSQGVLAYVDGHWTVNKAEPTAAVPESLRQMIEQRLAYVQPTARTVLEVASVVGAEFSIAAVAAGVEATVETVEEQCTELARQEQFLRASGTATWPDGTVATRYSFRHALYQDVLYERLAVGRRQRLHQRLGERLEQAYGERAREIAAELAVHFEQGRDYPRAVPYLQRAAENAVRKHAYPETIALLTRGLELLPRLSDTEARWRQEFALCMRLSPVLMATKGYAAPDVEATLTGALALSWQIGDERYRIQVLLALAGFYMFRGELQQARACGEQCLELGQQTQRVSALLWSHYLLGVILFLVGELAAARTHLTEATTLYGRQPPGTHTFRGLDDPGVRCHSDMGLVLWCLGYPDQALQQSRDALILGHKLAYPLSLASAWHLSGVLHQLRGEHTRTREHAEALLALATTHGISPPRAAGGLMLRGWTIAVQGDRAEGLAHLHQGLMNWESVGTRILRPYALATLAEVYLQGGQHATGLALVQEALALINTTRERWYEAELYRLKGQLTLQSKTSFGQVSGKSGHVHNPQHLTPSPQAEAEAEACFLKAIEIARRQNAKSLELRAAISLSRLWQQQGREEQAQQMLAEIYGWFTEGFDTADLQEAAVLLKELA